MHPVIKMDPRSTLVDFSGPPAQRKLPKHQWIVGGYDEVRPHVYTQDLFADQEPRVVHMGLDLGAPVGTNVFAFSAGVLRYQQALPLPGDYGHAIVVEHRFNERPLWVLYGHLSANSIQAHKPGYIFDEGEVIGWLGCEAENGGWPPHLHLQGSWTDPKQADLPGACSLSDRQRAKQAGPNPWLLMGSWRPNKRPKSK